MKKKNGITVDKLIIGKKYWLDSDKDESGIFAKIDDNEVFFEPLIIINYFIEPDGEDKGLIIFDRAGAGVFYEID